MRTLVTVGCFVVLFASAASRMDDSASAASKGVTILSLRSDAANRVKLSPAGLYYYEGDNSLRLTAELGSDTKGAFYYVYVWTPTAWVREMPAWCRHRREEVLSEIRRLTADRRIKWIEED